MYSLRFACAWILPALSAVVSAQDPLAPMRDVIATKRDAVVHVYVRIAKQKDRFGKEWFKDENDKRSGVILDPSGLVLTHWTVAAEAFDAEGAPRDGHSLEVRLRDGRTFAATLLARDEGADLALLQFAAPTVTAPTESELPWFELGDSANAAPGRLVAAIGMPDDLAEVVFVGALSQAVSGVQLGTRALAANEILLSDASMRPENNAGALVDATGRLLGLCNSKFFVPPKQEPDPAATPELSFGVAVAAHAIRAAFAEAFANPSLRNQTLRAAPARGADTPTTASEAAVARVADAIVSVRAGDADSADDGDAAGESDPYAERRLRGVGSGVVVDSTGLILTNAHLAANSKELVVTRRDGKRFDAELLASDQKLDIAVLRVVGSGHGDFVFAELGRSADVVRGEQILALGNSRGTALSVGVGVLSSANRAARVGGSWWATEGLLQVDAPVHPGNSGGALVDLAGRVVGILNAGGSDARVLGDEKLDTNIGFAVPVDAIRSEFRDTFDRHTGRNPTLASSPPTTDAERDRRRSDVTALVERLAPSLVSVYVAVAVARAESFDPFADTDREVQARGLGSGVIIESSGLALTNWHVIDGADDVMVETGDGQNYKAKVLSSSRIDDLALLQLELPEGTTVPAVAMGNSGELPIGSTVVAIGNPYGHANTVTVGVLSAKNQAIHVKGRGRMFEGLLQTDAAINPGNSGGALLDLHGRLVGINSAGSTAEAEVGYAIPVDHAREKFESELLSVEKLGASYLGLVVVDEDGRAVVRTIDPNGPAARAGFEVGDVVTAVESTAVASRVDFVRFTMGAIADKPLAIKLRRDETALELHPQPISGAAWRVFRQTGVESETIDDTAEGETIRRAHLLLHRHFTGDSTGSPTRVPTTAVRVVRLHPLEVEKGLKLEVGDVLLGIEVNERQAFGGERSRLEPFETVAAMSSTFDRFASKSGHAQTLLVVRNGELLEVQLGIRRVE